MKQGEIILPQTAELSSNGLISVVVGGRSMVSEWEMLVLVSVAEVLWWLEPNTAQEKVLAFLSLTQL